MIIKEDEEGYIATNFLNHEDVEFKFDNINSMLACFTNAVNKVNKYRKGMPGWEHISVLMFTKNVPTVEEEICQSMCQNYIDGMDEEINKYLRSKGYKLGDDK